MKQNKRKKNFRVKFTTVVGNIENFYNFTMAICNIRFLMKALFSVEKLIPFNELFKRENAHITIILITE